MAQSRGSILRALWAPKLVRVLALAVGGVAAYDSFSSQFGLPTLGRVLGTSGSLLPWWGWLVVLEAVFLYALFEYVRRNVSSTDGSPPLLPIAEAVQPLSERQQQVERRLTQVETTLKDTPSEARVVAHIAKFAGAKTSEVLERVSRIEESATQLEALTGRLDEQRTWLKSLENQQSAVAERLEAKITSEVAGIQTLLKKLEDRVSLSFYALRTKEALEELAEQIEQDADTLYSRLSEGDVYDRGSWAEWEKVSYNFTARLRAWVEHGKWYFGDLTTAVLEVPDHKYGGEWTVSDGQFPDAEAVRVFKKFRIIYSQWNEVRDKVRENLYYVAYHGMSDTEVRHGEPAR